MMAQVDIQGVIRRVTVVHVALNHRVRRLGIGGGGGIADGPVLGVPGDPIRPSAIGGLGCAGLPLGGAENGVFPIHADARSLPFASEFFDAIVSIDSFCYYGTDDLYLNYLARFVKPGGQIGIAGAGLTDRKSTRLNSSHLG